jgi:hypothetical protein
MSSSVRFDKQPQAAFIDVRLLPWRPRPRRLRRGRANDTLDRLDLLDGVGGFDDLGGLALGVFIAVVIYLAAPLLLIILGFLLLPIEMIVVAILGALILLVRFAGVVPWTVVVTNRDDTAQSERYRNVLRAVSRVRSINSDGRMAVRFSLC